MKLIFLVTEDSYFFSHRLPMARAAQQMGFSVIVVTRVTNYRTAIEDAGIRVIDLSLERQSLNPIKAFKHIFQICRIYRVERPDLVHHIAMKPILLGSLAAWLAKVPIVINAFAGLGYLFTSHAAKAVSLRLAILPMFRFLLRRRASYTLLQNQDDQKILEKIYLIEPARTLVIAGSGVELEKFQVQDFSTAPPFTAVFVGRMIAIKGLSTLERAFALLAIRAPQIKLLLCGMPDLANPSSWTLADLQRWAKQAENVEYRGYCPDMAAIWRQAHVAVQPSLGGEGIPKSLLEAAVCGRAIIATDVPGCREMVTAENGILIPPDDAEALATALESLAEDVERCRIMGLASRQLVLDRGLDAASITAQTAAFYQRCFKRV